jgi:hypothetical protein
MGSRIAGGGRTGVDQDPQHAAHVGHGPATRPLDGRQGRARVLRPLVDGQPGGPGLDDHHAHVMADDVVQLARDPVALILDRAIGGTQRGRSLQPCGLGHRVRITPTRLRPVAQGPGPGHGEKGLDHP